MRRKTRYHPFPLSTIQALCSRSATVLFFDTAAGSARNRCSYVFTDPVRTVQADDYRDLEPVCAEIERLAATNWVAGYLSYEAAYALEPAFLPLRSSPAPGCFPLAWFGVFEPPIVFDHLTGRLTGRVETPGGAGEKAPPGAAVTLFPAGGLDHRAYASSIASIKRLIARGETYQVNFTFDMVLDTELAPFALYCQVRRRQPAAYSAFIRTGHGHIASFSPELFFETNFRSIRVRPMKGTARRGRFAAEDREVKKALSRDEKNRAENVMITDLMRNDLARVCRFGSVRTVRLCEVETLPTLHQMTSTVQGALNPGVGFTGIVRALFPSGSVTGAPKIHTMEIIHRLENGPRGVYTGMIGFMSPSGRAVFNVPIRTIEKPKGSKHWRFRVGGGIVWDSNARQEWDECMAKSAFLSAGVGDFELLESIKLLNGRFLYLREHCGRMLESASFFGYPLDREVLGALLDRIAARLARRAGAKVRVLCDRTGRLRWESAPLRSGIRPGRDLVFSESPVDRTNLFLFHKTTFRPWYEAAMARAARGRMYDTVFENTDGQITECSMNNIFVEAGGALYTPPIECGLLPGVLRQVLLRRGACREKILTRDDIMGADGVYCGNSVRGLVKVAVCGKNGR